MNAAVPKQMDELPKRDAGSVLRSAREAAGMTVLDVSRQLNLGEAIIEALENGDMNALPPPAFVRGYVRSYGKLLELDVEALLEVLDQSAASDPDIAPVTMLSSQRLSGDPLMRWMSVAVFFVLAVMVVVWWQTKNGAEEPLTAQPESAPMQQPEQSQEMLALQKELQTVTPKPAPEATAVEPTPLVAEPDVVVDPQPEEAAVAADAERALAAADGAPSSETIEIAGDDPFSAPMQEATAAADAGPGETASVSETAPDEFSAAGAEAMEPEGEPPPQVVATSETQPAPPAPTAALAAAAESFEPGPAAGDEGDEVVLLIDGSSWMEVRDAVGEQLYYGLYDSPAPLRLTGQLPFEMFLGNSPAVTIVFNGETYDQTSFNRANNTARFALDNAGLRRP